MYSPDGARLPLIGQDGLLRRREDLIGENREVDPLIGPEGDIRGTGKNNLRPRRLDPVRTLDMGLEIHENVPRRRLNMINPENRTMRVGDINISAAQNQRMMDSDDSG